MRVRHRKLIGAFLLIGLVIVWALLAMAFAQPLVGGASGWLAGLYYLVAGMGWVLPAMPLVKWMQRA